MKTKNIILTVFSLTGLTLTSCSRDGICTKGDGNKETVTVRLDDFNALDLGESGVVTITQGDVQNVTVTGDGNIIDLLETDVRNGVWTVELENGCYRDYDLKIDITIPDLHSIFLSGSGKIYVNAFDKQPNLDISISGSGKVELERFQDTRNLDVRISGSGDVIGYDNFDMLRNLDVRISGSGNYDAYAIETENADIKISGSGDCYTTVNNALDVNISGSGRVRYKGSPTVKKSISGSGSVRKTD
ncbi:MAG: hypothetical protein ACI9UJ_001168 [bacterium]|jgi:hypothetical protein